MFLHKILNLGNYNPDFLPGTDALVLLLSLTTTVNSLDILQNSTVVYG